MAVVNQFIQDDVSLLYTAFFGRAPDATGYTYWVQQMAATPGTSTQSGAADASQALAKSFALVPEFATTYGSLTPSEQIDTLYTNILNRPADAAGKAYWLNEMNNGTAFSTVAWQVVYACFLGGDTVDPADAALVQNKVAVSEYFAGTLHSNDITLAESAFLTVTSDPATVTSTEAALLVASANQITLTPLVETYYGVSGNNTFNAMGYVTSTGTVVQTLQDGDSLIGSVNGTNTLNANLINSGTVTPNALTNIQQLVLTNVAGTGFDLTNAAAVDSVTLNALNANLSINNAQSSAIAYAVNNTSTSAVAAGGSQKVVGVDLNTTAAAGVGDVAALTVRNSSISLNLDTGYESLTVASVGSNSVSTDFAGDVTVSGAGNFVLTGSAGAAVLTTDIDTTALTGTFQATLASGDTVFVGGNGNTTLTNNTGVNAITLGNGTNSLTTAIGDLNNDVVVGGTGLDSLALSAQTNDVGGTTAETALANVSNFDTLILATGANSNSLTIGTNFVDAGFTSIIGSVTNDLIVASNVALTNLTFLGGGGTDEFQFNNTASGTVTVNQVATVSSGSAAGVANQVVNIAGATSSTSVTLGAGTDTVNILSDGQGSVTVNGVEIVNSGASLTGNTVILANDSTAVTVNGGAGNLTINANAASTAANSFLFGNATNTLQIDELAAISNAATVSGGTGVDTLAITAQLVGGVDASFATVNNFETLTLSNAGTNSLTIGTNFVAADFTTITGSASGDLVVASNVALSGLTFNGGAGTDTFTFNNTASGTVTVSSVDVVDSGSAAGVANQTVNIADVATAGLASDTVTVTLGAGTDTVNINNTSGLVSVTVSGVEIVNSGASLTGNTVILANDSTAVTVNGGAGNLTINANAASTAANSFLFGNATNTLQIDELAAISNAATVSGGTGVDTLAITAQLVGGVDASFATVNNFETLTLSNAGTNSLTIGTNFVAADFTTITGSASGDLVVASNVALSGLTFNGGAGTDTLALNTASGTVTINAVETVTSSGSADILLTVAQSSTAASASIDLGAGTDGLINLNTAGLTVTLSGAETYLGSLGVDTVTLGSASAISINGGGGTDSVTLAVNTSNVTVLAGSGAAMSVVGNFAATADALAISGAGTYNLTSVETVTVSGAAASTVNSWLFATSATSGVTAGDNTLFTYNLSDNDIAGFTMKNQTAGVTGGSVLLTVNAGDNATISFNNSSLIAGQTGDSLIVTKDVGYTSITLGGTSSDAIQTNLGSLTIGTSTADSFVAANFGAAGSDTIDLTGATLTSGLGVGTVLHTTYLNASGFQNTDAFTLNTTFVTGNSTTLANISQTSGANQNAVIFNFGMGSTTADFTTQAGINTAVTYITGNIGTTTSGSQSAVMAVADGNGHNALFLFQDDGTSGIDATDLKLIGVVTGSVSASTFS